MSSKGCKRKIRKKEKESNNAKLPILRGKCVVAKGGKLSIWPLPQCSYERRK